MKLLNENQKKILSHLSEVYPNNLTHEVLLEKLSMTQEDILSDIKILEKNNLVTVIYPLGRYYPSTLCITPEGIEKLQENFLTRLKVTAYDNPWAAITVIFLIVSAISGAVGIYYYNENLSLQKEKALLEKPLVITPDTRVRGNSNAEFKFIVKNPSHSIDYYYINGKCTPETPQFFSRPLPSIKDTGGEPSNDSDSQISMPLSVTNEKQIPAKSELTLYCSYYISNPTTDVLTYFDVCVNIRNIGEPICNKMKVTILKI